MIIDNIIGLFKLKNMTLQNFQLYLIITKMPKNHSRKREPENSAFIKGSVSVYFVYKNKDEATERTDN